MFDPRDVGLEALGRRFESLREENEELRRQLAASRDDKDSYRTLYEALPVSLMVTDKDGVIIGVNPFHVQNMGKGRTMARDYIGQPILTRPSIVASGLTSQMASVLGGVAFEEDEVHFPRLSGGGEGYFNVRGVPLRTDEGIVGTIFMSIDVTALHLVTEELRRHREKLEELVAQRTTELTAANANVKTLSGFIPICASCKKIRDDDGFWTQIEIYLSERSDAQFSHGICPDCSRKLYGDFADDS